MSYSRPDIASSSQQHAIDNHFIPAGGDVGYVDRHVEYEEELGSGYHSESECSGDTDDSDQDIEDHEDDDANLTSNDHLAHKAPLSDLEQLGRTKGGVIGDQHYPTSQDSIPRAREGAFVGYAGSGEEHSKPPGRLRSFAGKARDHLRDENNRRRVLQGVQKGIVKVKDLMMEVQATDKVVAGAQGQGTTSNGKKLAKACVKIAVARLAKRRRNAVRYGLQMMVRIESRHCNLQMDNYDGDSSWNIALNIKPNHKPYTCHLNFLYSYFNGDMKNSPDNRRSAVYPDSLDSVYPQSQSDEGITYAHAYTSQQISSKIRSCHKCQRFNVLKYMNSCSQILNHDCHQRYLSFNTDPQTSILQQRNTIIVTIPTTIMCNNLNTNFFYLEPDTCPPERIPAGTKPVANLGEAPGKTKECKEQCTAPKSSDSKATEKKNEETDRKDQLGPGC